MKIDIRKAFALGAKKYQERSEEERRILKEANKIWHDQEEKRMEIVVKNQRAVARKKEANQKRRDTYRKKRADELYGKRLRPDASPDRKSDNPLIEQQQQQQQQQGCVGSISRQPPPALVSHEAMLSACMDDNKKTTQGNTRKSKYNRYQPEYIIRALQYWVDLANKGLKERKRNRDTVEYMNYNHDGTTLQESTFRGWRKAFVFQKKDDDGATPRLMYVVDEEKVISYKTKGRPRRTRKTATST